MRIDIDKVTQILREDADGCGGISMGAVADNGEDKLIMVFTLPKHAEALRTAVKEIIDNFKAEKDPVCRDCSGSGKDFNPADFSSKTCKKCNGTGKTK